MGGGVARQGSATTSLLSDVFAPLTRSLCIGKLHSGCLVTCSRPLQMRVSELEETRELFVGRLSGADEGRHVGVHSCPPRIR